MIRPTIEYPMGDVPIYLVDSDTAILPLPIPMHDSDDLLMPCANRVTVTHRLPRQKRQKRIRLKSQPVLWARPIRLTERGRLWRNLAIFQSAFFLILSFILVCVAW